MTEFDAGPPWEFAEMFARSPNYEPYKDHFWYDWGPVFYRGRLDGSAWGRASSPRHNNSVSRPSPDDGHTLTWIAPEPPRLP